LEGLLADATHHVTTIIVSVDEMPAGRFDRLCRIAARHGVEVRQLRVWLDEVDTGRLRRTAGGVVPFR
jgi:hypothetical protein